MTTHRIYIEELKKDNSEFYDRSYWECSCGSSGSCPSERVDLASDRHIKYDLGDTRIDVAKPHD